MKKKDPWPDIKFRPRPSRFNHIFHGCLGSLRAEHGITETSTRTDRNLQDRGVSIHEAVQAWIAGDKDAEEKYISLEIEERSDVRELRHQIEGIIAKEGKPKLILTEYMLCDLIPLPLQDDTGTADIILLYDTKVIVIDIKRFIEQPRAEEHMQLILYTIGTAWRWPKLNEFLLICLQPGHEINYFRATRPWLEMWTDKMLEMIKGAQLEDAPRVPSPDVCRWCKAWATERCPETVAQIEALKIHKTGIPMTRDMTIWLIRNGKLLTEAVDKAKGLARSNPELYKDYVTVRTPTTQRYISNDQGAAALMISDLQFTAEECLDCAKLSREKVIDLLAMKNQCTREQAEATFDKVMREYGYLGERSKAAAVVPKPGGIITAKKLLDEMKESE